MTATSSPTTTGAPVGPLVYEDCILIKDQAVVGMSASPEPISNDAKYLAVQYFVPTWDEPFSETLPGFINHPDVYAPIGWHGRNITTDGTEKDVLCASELAHAFARRVRNTENNRVEDGADSIITSYMRGMIVNYDPTAADPWKQVAPPIGNTNKIDETILRQFEMIGQASSHRRRLQMLRDNLDSYNHRIRNTANLCLSLLGDLHSIYELEIPPKLEAGESPRDNVTWSISQPLYDENATTVNDGTTITIAPPEPDMLLASLRDLWEAPERAEDDDWPIPAQEHLERTERLLRRMFRVEPHPYWVYPTSSREMIIDCGDDDMRIIVKIFHDYRVIYTYEDVVTGELCAIKHLDIENLPDREMRQILSRLSME